MGNYPSFSVVRVSRVTAAALISDTDLTGLRVVLGNEDAALYEQANQVHGGEVIHATQLLEADDATDGHAILEQNNCGEHLNIEFLHEEGALLGIDADEASLSVDLADFEHVHVYDFASLEVLVEKGANHVVGLCHGRKELQLGDLSICAVSVSNISALFVVVSSSISYALLSDPAQHGLFLFIHCEVGVDLLLLQVVTVCRICLVVMEVFLGLLSGHVLCLDHSGFVFDSLLHHHLSEQVSRQLVVCLHVCHFLSLLLRLNKVSFPEKS